MRRFLGEDWFGGFAVKNWKENLNILDEPGVYLIVRTSVERPKFKPNSKVKIRRNKGSETLSFHQLLEEKWVANQSVLYVGTTTRTLKQR